MPELAAGSRIRITAADLGLDRAPFAFLGREGEYLLVRDGELTRYAISQLERVDLHAGTRSTVGKGLGLGALAGLGLGLGLAVVGKASCGSEQTCGTWWVAAPSGGIALGAMVGTVIGLSTRRDVWRELPLNTLRLGMRTRGWGVYRFQSAFRF